MDRELTQEEKRILLKLARDTITQWVTEGKKPPLPKATGMLGEPCGCFVTVHEHGQLRGCIGNMVGRGPLVELVQEMAIASSTGDPRFHAVSKEELPEIDIEISVLTPMRKVDDPENDVILGKHGIYIKKKGGRGGTYLPQVATDHNMSFEEFMGTCCAHKAGLPRNAWKTDPDVEVYVYEAIVFSEEH